MILALAVFTLAVIAEMAWAEHHAIRRARAFTAWADEALEVVADRSELDELERMWDA